MERYRKLKTIIRKFAIIGLEKIVVVDSNNICLIANANFKDDDIKKLSEKIDFEK